MNDKKTPDPNSPKEQALAALLKAHTTASSMAPSLDQATLLLQVGHARLMVLAIEELKRPRRKGAAKKKERDANPREVAILGGDPSL